MVAWVKERSRGSVGDASHKERWVHLSPCGRGIGRLRRPFLGRTPKRSFGYVASLDAIRVRGFSLSIDLTPHPNPLPQGERERTFIAAIIRTYFINLERDIDIVAAIAASRNPDPPERDFSDSTAPSRQQRSQE
jgi:hypothetical protein